MADRVLLTTAKHPPWTEEMARTVADIETGETTVDILYVFDEAERKSTQRNLNLDDGVVDADELAERKEDVAIAESVLEKADLRYEVVGTVNEDPAEAILDTAWERNVDRIYIYSSGRNPVGKAVFGSTLQDVILGAAVPVIVTPAGFS